MVAESQGVILRAGADGRPEVEDYTGGRRSYDAEPDDWYECDECGTHVSPRGDLLRGEIARSGGEPATPRVTDVDDDGERLSCEGCGESFNVNESGREDRCPRCA